MGEEEKQKGPQLLRSLCKVVLRRGGQRTEKAVSDGIPWHATEKQFSLLKGGEEEASHILKI